MYDAVEISTKCTAPDVGTRQSDGGATTAKRDLLISDMALLGQRCWHFSSTKITRPREHHIWDGLGCRSIFLNARLLPRRAKLSTRLIHHLKGSSCVLTCGQDMFDLGIYRLVLRRIVLTRHLKGSSQNLGKRRTSTMRNWEQGQRLILEEHFEERTIPTGNTTRTCHGESQE